MKRRFTILTAAFALLAFLAIPMGMRGQTASFAPSDFSGQGTSGTGSAISATVDGVTFACDKGYGTTQIRCYSGGVITISSSNTITAISFTFSGSYTGGMETSYTNLSTTSWTKTLSSQARITACSVSYTGGDTPQPTTYTVTFDAGEGTFAGNTDFPNASNTVVAGTYSLPSATPAEGYVFNGWALGENTYEGGANYTVSGNADFVASYTENTTPTPGGTTATLNIQAYAEANSWTNGTQYTTATVAPVTFTANGGGNTGKYYESGHDWRFYQGESASITITVTEGYTLVSVTPTYSVSNGGVLKNGNTTIATGTTVNVSGTSVTFTVGNSGSATNGQVRFTNIDVVYVSDGGTQTASDLTITNQSTDLTFDLYNNTTAQVISYTTSSTGAITITPAESDYFSYVHDAAAKTITVTPTAVTPSAQTVTISQAADDDYYAGTATFTVSVANSDPNLPGTQNNPYTVAQARAAIDANTGLVNVYATGIISQVDSYNSNYNSITYWISDDGTTTSDQLEVYSGKGLNNTNFSSINDVEVGATVVVYGTLKKYNSIYEFDKNNYLVSYEAPIHDVATPTFSPAAGTYAETQTVTIICSTQGADIYYTLDGTEPNDESNPYSSPITVSETTTIKAIAYADDVASTIATATYHINSQANPYTVAQALAFNEYPANGIYVHGIVSTAPAQDPTNNGELTYYISDNGEATNQLEVYKGKGLEQAAFTAQNDIQVGDIVTIYGNVQVYSNTIEFASGNYLVEFERPTIVVPSVTVTPNIINAPAEGAEGNLALAYENITEFYSFDFYFCDAEGEELQEDPDWIYAEINPGADDTYILDYLIDANNGEARTAYMKVYTYDDDEEEVYAIVTVNQAAPVAPATGDEYALYTGELVEGDYLIVYDGGAMNTTVTNDRLQYEDVTVNNDVIVTDNAAIVWHIAPSGQYWTIYNADAEAYAASTGAKNKAQMLANGTDDKALWTVSGTETYEFVNKQNTANNVNANLRKNGTYGFACYAAGTGGALSLYKKVEATETYTLTITGYQEGSKGGYHLIASPVTVDPATVEGMILTGDDAENYDLYRYDDSQELEWINYKGANGGFNLEPGKGYLYAKKNATAETTTTYNFTLTGTPYSGNGEIELVAGWNLIGNPFNEIVYLEGNPAFYTMNAEGTEIVTATSNSIQAMEGIFVEAESAGTVTFTTTAPTKTNEGIVLNLSHNRGNVVDRAIVRFGEGSQLHKLQIRNNSTKVYIPQNNDEYAVVRGASQGEMPVSFRAAENGNYTFSINAENVELNYLHLIDNMTGANIDLLQNPSYSFDANTTDYESRFRLVYAANNAINEQSVENFAFFSNGNLIVNNEGNATLQVVDITGRLISSNSINGSENINLHNMPAGIYTVRLINGKDVKVQKVAVR